MLFNSIDFAFFLPIVFICYWTIIRYLPKFQNFFLLTASYVFYGWWDWRFLTLIALSSLTDFFISIFIARESNQFTRKVLLGLSLASNLGLLVYFKYFNFFVDSFAEVFSFLGNEIEAHRLSIVLPVGISFYTFQTLSYTLDTYRNRLTPTKDIIQFFAFVSFFPQLVAGPIERAVNLLPQFNQSRKFSYSKAVDGCRQILWGFFKKVVIADNCATYADLLFENFSDYSGLVLLLGAILFSFQIYGDFSGYSDIAIGTGKLFGFNLMQNFAFPYFSRDVAEFWRRWHISLSTWFRDYLYIPLGGSRKSQLMNLRNVLIVFTVSGLWHGANWTYVTWGVLHGLLFVPLLLFKRNRIHTNSVAEKARLPTFMETAQILQTFLLVSIIWIFFRASSMENAIGYVQKLFHGILSWSSIVNFYNFIHWELGYLIPAGIILMITVEWSQRKTEFGIQRFAISQPRFVRWSFYLVLCFLIGLSSGKEVEFIYFQF